MTGEIGTTGPGRGRRRWGDRLVPILLIATVAGLLWWSSRPPGDQPAWMEDPEAATALARESGRPLLVFFTADWCPPCRTLKRGALADERVIERVERDFVPLKIDLTEADAPHASVAERHGVRSIPTVLVVGAGGRAAHRVEGAVGPENFLAFLERAAPVADRATDAERGASGSE